MKSNEAKLKFAGPIDFIRVILLYPFRVRRRLLGGGSSPPEILRMGGMQNTSPPDPLRMEGKSIPPILMVGKFFDFPLIF